MKEFNITMQADIRVQFDEESEEFKELWKQYLEYFDSSATYESFSENIASIISRYGIQEFIEGVGYVKHFGDNQTLWNNGEYKEVGGIVNVEVAADLNAMVDFIVYDTQEII